MKFNRRLLLAVLLIPMFVGATVLGLLMITLPGQINFTQAQSKIEWSSTNAPSFGDVNGVIAGDSYSATMSYYIDAEVSIDGIVSLLRKPAYSTEVVDVIWAGEDIASGLCEYIRINVEYDGYVGTILQWDNTGVASVVGDMDFSANGPDYIVISIEYKWTATPTAITFTCSAESA